MSCSIEVSNALIIERANLSLSEICSSKNLIVLVVRQAY